jgi:hypothetical protein
MPKPDFVMHYTDAEVDWRRAQNVEVIMHEPDPPEVQETMGSNPSASISSSAADSSVLDEKAIATMDLELAAQANDPERKARSQDRGWKFG